MKRAFTLMELLVVIAIMGLLGTTAVGGYRAMQRGMEQRAVMENANKFIRAAFQRAQIDRVPVAIFFWNETLREETDDEPLVAVGKAVAVRRSGRISALRGSGRTGGIIVNEFDDLSFASFAGDTDDESRDNVGVADLKVQTGARLYPMNGSKDGSNVKPSIVAQSTIATEQQVFLFRNDTDTPDTATVEAYGYYIQDDNGNNWKVGDAYGMEFAEIQLPHGYLFGSKFKKTIADPVDGDTVMRFKPGTGVSSSGAVSGAQDGTQMTIAIYNLRPGTSGEVSAEPVGNTGDPSEAE